MTTPTTQAAIAAARFVGLAQTAANNGGFWVSAAGGTASAVAGEIAARTGVTFNEARKILDRVCTDLIGNDWYAWMAEIQPFPMCTIPEWDARWDARTIARAACR